MKNQRQKPNDEDFLIIKNKLGTPGVYAKIANEILKATKHEKIFEILKVSILSIALKFIYGTNRKKL